MINLSLLLGIFQSTLPRGERPWTAANPILADGISIHAPTWGATFFLFGTPICSCYFNPRSHVGSDKNFRSLSFGCYISIHAPTWGATCLQTIQVKRDTNFNPRSHVGSDPCFTKSLEIIHNFNPRSHVGSDPYFFM